MSWFLAALKKYAEFSGRSQRSEYWYFGLFYVLLYVAAIVIDLATGLYNEASGFGVFSTVVWLGLLIPSLSVSVRRLHDTSRTGWWLLIGLVPLIGFIVLIVFFVQDSEATENQYGANPKATAI